MQTGGRGIGDGGNELALSGLIAGSRVAIVVTDPAGPDNPITYVNDAFERLTLYRREDVVGRDCRFLQGEGTDPAEAARLRDGLASGEDFVVTLTHYRADGTPFRNQVFVTPVHDEAGSLTAHFGLHRPVDAEEAALRDRRAISDETMLKELQHRVKNHLAMVVSLIRLQSRRDVTADSFRDLSHRIEALSLFYDELYKAGRDGAGQVPNAVEAGPYLQRVAAAVTGIEGQTSVRLDIDCDEVALPVDTTARLGLLLSEFLTNAVKHAFVDRESGAISVRLRRAPDGGVRLSVADDGVGLPGGSTFPEGARSLSEQHDRAESEGGALDTTGSDGAAGLGGSIVDGLARSIGAQVLVRSEGDGTCFEVRVPAETLPDAAGPRDGAG